MLDLGAENGIGLPHVGDGLELVEHHEDPVPVRLAACGGNASSASSVWAGGLSSARKTPWPMSMPNLAPAARKPPSATPASARSNAVRTFVWFRSLKAAASRRLMSSMLSTPCRSHTTTAKSLSASQSWARRPITLVLPKRRGP